MRVVRIVSPDLGNNTYVLVGSLCVMIDPSLNVDAVVAAAKKYKPSLVIITHAHFDHVFSLGKVKEAVKTKIVAHKLEGLNADILVEDGDLIEAEDIRLRVLHTPGHTKGSICLYEEMSKSLFSGDTLFPDGSFGRVDLPGGSLSEMTESLKKLSKVDAEMLYPGHEEPVNNARKHILAAMKEAQQLIE